MQAVTTEVLGDPQGTRPATGWTAELVATRDLDDGRTARIAWLYASQTHVHVIVWVPESGLLAVRENIARFNAARVAEKILREMES